MNATKGYYSLVQYCPDVARQEAANVGVVLFCPELAFLEARLASSNHRIRRFFGEEADQYRHPGQAAGLGMKTGNAANGKRHATPQSLNAAVKSICDIMRRSNVAGAMNYVPELTWILFLRILDERETHEAEEAEALGLPFTPCIGTPYRWHDWAAPDAKLRRDTKASVWDFVHEELLPYLKALKDKAAATSRQKVISQIMSSVERSRIDSEKNFCDVLDKVHELSNETVDPTRVFALSQVYEGPLLKMGEKGNDGGQFFTPRDYDLSEVKVGKKTPLTQKHFEDFIRLLPTRGDGPNSWTNDFTAKLEQALEEARPYRQKAGELFAEAKTLQDDLREKTKTKILSRAKLDELEEKWKSTERAARESFSKAEAIENAVYDLKAVNPKRVSQEDLRTPAQLLDLIAEKGREADAALDRLRQLTAQSRVNASPSAPERRRD